MPPVPTPAAAAPAFFRFRKVAGRMVVTNQEGSFVILAEDEFARFARGQVEPDSELWRRLSDGNFLRATFRERRAVEHLGRRKAFLRFGPNLHILVVTLRCNQTCAYCHSSRADLDAVGVDMSADTAERAVDRALASTSPRVTIEFQGGEPLVNFAVVRHAISYARAQNRRAGKQLDFTMVSNLSLMDEDKLAWLIAERVQICTSVDGPADLHDGQRRLPGLSAHAAASGWIARINRAYAEAGLDPSLYHVEALLTTTRAALTRGPEIVATYVLLGCRALFLRPLDPFGFAERTAGRLGYSVAEFLQFYRDTVDYLIAENRRGVDILERTAAIFLTKILTGDDPNYLDIRSPCGAGIGQVAYDHDGRVYTCDEGRMLRAMGDDTFAIGDVREHSYRELVSHPTVRSLAIASNLDGQPGCVNCAYLPYCGVCPVHSHRTQGSIFGRMADSTLCGVYKGIQDYLFERLGEGDPETLAIFRRWTVAREREHFVHAPA